MKQDLKFFAVAMAAFVLGMGLNNFAMSGVPANYKVAVVDVQKVISQSSQVAALKKDQQAKMNNLINFVDTARKNIAKEKDPKKRRALEEKYNKEFDTKKAAIEKEYIIKLKAIDTNISNIVNGKAKAGNYNLVLAKGVVLFGGTDITAEISKAVK